MLRVVAHVVHYNGIFWQGGLKVPHFQSLLSTFVPFVPDSCDYIVWSFVSQDTAAEPDLRVLPVLLRGVLFPLSPGSFLLTG